MDRSARTGVDLAGFSVLDHGLIQGSSRQVLGSILNSGIIHTRITAPVIRGWLIPLFNILPRTWRLLPWIRPWSRTENPARSTPVRALRSMWTPGAWEENCRLPIWNSAGGRTRMRYWYYRERRETL